MKTLAQYLKSYKLSIIMVIIFAIGSAAFSIVGPKVLGKATTEIFNGLVKKITTTNAEGINFTRIGQIILFLVGLYLIGFDENNLLRIISLDGMNKAQVEELIKTEKIRDAVAFQEESSDKNNHFVKLIINGEKRELNGMGSGANPRTAIGQRKDGSVLILVTDGRGKNGHLGATASDIIDIMAEYGAVNAANLDGGSSSSLYYNHEYLMTSVTFYYANSSWRLPTAFVVKDN